MIRALFIKVMMLFLLACPVQAERIVLGLSQDSVSISTTFDGSDILIFGAISRDTPVPTDAGELGVIITVTGPGVPMTVWRKERQFGIWVNVDKMDVYRAPSFYAVASSGSLDETLNVGEDLKRTITINRAIKSFDRSLLDSDLFVDGLVRAKKRSELYQLLEGAVTVEQDTLFRTSIRLPANLFEGDYRTKIFLTRGGTVIDQFNTVIPVTKVGLERWLYNLAYEQSLIYGLLSLVLAIAAGWVASTVFAYIRR